MATDYTIDSQRNLLRVLDCLGQRPLEAQSLGAVQQHTGISRDQTFRTLWNLEQEGWIERASDSGYRLSPRLTQYSERLRLALAELHSRYLA